MADLHNLQRTILYCGRYFNRSILATFCGYQSGIKLYGSQWKLSGYRRMRKALTRVAVERLDHRAQPIPKLTAGGDAKPSAPSAASSRIRASKEMESILLCTKSAGYHK